MTECEWLKAIHPDPMLRFLPWIGFDRKYRLFACACASRVLNLCEDAIPRLALQMAELYADGLCSQEDVRSIVTQAHNFAKEEEKCLHWITSCAAAALSGAGYISDQTSRMQFDAFTSASCYFSAGLAIAAAAKGKTNGLEGNEHYVQAEAVERAIQSALLRDIFGNVFRPEHILDETSIPSSVLTIAKEIYDQKSFEQLSQLGELLEKAGCANTGLIQHMR